jgi:hypothetical protein
MTAPLTAADTRLDPRLTRAFGVAELHAIHFAPRDDRGGRRNAVSVLVPEASRQMVRRALAVARRRRGERLDRVRYAPPGPEDARGRRAAVARTSIYRARAGQGRRLGRPAVTGDRKLMVIVAGQRWGRLVVVNEKRRGRRRYQRPVLRLSTASPPRLLCPRCRP